MKTIVRYPSYLAVVALVVGAAVCLGFQRAASAASVETGPNISGESGLSLSESVGAVDKIGPNVSGESTARDNPRPLLRQDVAGPGENLRIDVPRMPDGRPWRPVRGLSRTEKMEMDDLEYRYEQGLIGEAEYYSRRNAIMERIGMQAEY